MKARIKWSKTGVLKFIGHLDVQRYFHKAMMRAELPVSFSKGMSPHQIMSFAAPLGIGMTSEGEYVDISFDWCYSGQEMLDRMNAVMNEGISVLEFKQIDEKEKNCMAVTAAAAAANNFFIIPPADSKEKTRNCIITHLHYTTKKSVRAAIF